MKVTIHEVEPRRAKNMLIAENLLSFFENFWAWIEGPGREFASPEVLIKMRELAAIEGIPMT